MQAFNSVFFTALIPIGGEIKSPFPKLELSGCMYTGGLYLVMRATSVFIFAWLICEQIRALGSHNSLPPVEQLLENGWGFCWFLLLQNLITGVMSSEWQLD